MEISNKKVIHDDFLKLSRGRVIETRSLRSGLAIGNDNYVSIIGSGFEGVTYVGGLVGKGYPEYISLVYDHGLEYYTRIYVYADDVYIFEEDTEPFNKLQKLNRGNYVVYVGRGDTRKNYVLLVRDY